MVNRQTIVGGFVLGGILLALGVLVLFSRLRPFEPVTRAVLVFEGSVNGLIVGSPVTFRGVRVGVVRHIRVQFDPGSRRAYIPVIVQLEPNRVTIGRSADSVRTVGLPRMVADGLRGQLNIQSFVTGQAEIDLDFRPDTPATLYNRVPELPEIPTLPGQLQQLRDQIANLPLHDLAEDAEHTLVSLQVLSEHIDRLLPPLVGSLTRTSDQSQLALATATAAIADLQARAGRTLRAIDRLSTDGDRQLAGRGAELSALLRASNRSVGQAQALLTRINALAAPRSAPRADVEASLRDLSAAASSLRGLAEDLDRNPQLLLTGRGR
ncbi:MlaD family protein [Lichenicoccus sp.]|uniref:MlaD family protein n=1 Tax=Lichenicoccus sp. TaxID=2781899 RepID=UPI003D0D0577